MSETTVPIHVGLIMDGNRRWAKEQGLLALAGHEKGMQTLVDVSLHGFENGVQYISAYAFSTENWSRTQEEVSYLMGLILKGVERYLDIFHEAGIKIVFLGSREGVSEPVIKAAEKTEERTKNNTNGTLAICFNYGGKEEIVHAVKQIMEQGVKPEEVTADVIAGALYYPEVPPVDLLIRTSGEQRTSGFMLYRSDYAELLFIRKHWPDMNKEDFNNALAEYAARKRRFGK
ncbi:MAG: uppS [Candidatus Saccharibacteria bacterium]|nr:uppS [Candidatus Saccharibacteria bacterium]